MLPVVWILFFVFLAFALLILDIFIPSGGVLLIASIASAVTATVLAFQYHYYAGLATLTVFLASTPWVVILAIKIWPSTPIGKMIIMRRPDPESEVLPDSEGNRELKALIGEVGIAESDLMPSGSVLIHGRRFDARSDSGLIEKKQAIRVVRVEYGSLVVDHLHGEGDVKPVHSPEKSKAQTGPAEVAHPPPLSERSLEEMTLEELGIGDLEVMTQDDDPDRQPKAK